MTYNGSPPPYNDAGRYPGSANSAPQYGVGAPYPPQQGYNSGDAYPPQQGYNPGAAYPPQQSYNQGAPYPPAQSSNAGNYREVGTGNASAGYYAGRAEPGYGSDDNFAAKSFDDGDVRRGFIKKVYCTLSVQLLVTVGIICIFVFVEKVKIFAYSHYYLVWVAFGLTFAIVIALACCENIRRKHPLNIILLGLFTLFESFLLGVIAASYSKEAVLTAAGITAGVTIALTLFAFQTKYDFTKYGTYLFVFLIVLMFFGFFCLIFQSEYLKLVYGCLGALLFSFYLVFDTQLMLGGKHKYALSPDEYIMASLNLYIDIVQLFMYILMIIGVVDN